MGSLQVIDEFHWCFNRVGKCHNWKDGKNSQTKLTLQLSEVDIATSHSGFLRHCQSFPFEDVLNVIILLHLGYLFSVTTKGLHINKNSLWSWETEISAFWWACCSQMLAVSHCCYSRLRYTSERLFCVQYINQTIKLASNLCVSVETQLLGLPFTVNKIWGN